MKQLSAAFCEFVFVPINWLKGSNVSEKTFTHTQTHTFRKTYFLYATRVLFSLTMFVAGIWGCDDLCLTSYSEHIINCSFWIYWKVYCSSPAEARQQTSLHPKKSYYEHICTEMNSFQWIGGISGFTCRGEVNVHRALIYSSTSVNLTNRVDRVAGFLTGILLSELFLLASASILPASKDVTG